MSEGETIEIVAGLFSLTYVRNPGAAFGMLAELPDPWRHAFFVAVSLVTVFFLIMIYRGIPAEHRLQRGSILVIVGGALGNLIDRFKYGEVIDFLDFHVSDWHWPAFNLADSCITVGIIVLVAASSFGSSVRTQRLPTAP
jgi:signal peptidase II